MFLTPQSSTSVAWINKQTTPAEVEFSIKEIWNFAAEPIIQIWASWIESKKNKIADFTV